MSEPIEDKPIEDNEEGELNTVVTPDPEIDVDPAVVTDEDEDDGDEVGEDGEDEDEDEEDSVSTKTPATETPAEKSEPYVLSGDLPPEEPSSPEDSDVTTQDTPALEQPYFNT